MSSLLSRRDLADMAGVSRQAVEKALGKGRLREIAGADGSHGFDPEALEVKAFITTAKKPRRVAQRARAQAAEPSTQTLPEIPTPAPPITLPLGGDLPLGDPNALDALKTAAQIQQIRLGVELKRERYVDRDIVRRFFSRFIAIDESEVKTLGDRLGSQLAIEARRAPTEDEAAIVCGRLVSDAMLKTLEHRKRRLREIRAELRTQAESEAANE